MIKILTLKYFIHLYHWTEDGDSPGRLNIKKDYSNYLCNARPPVHNLILCHYATRLFDTQNYTLTAKIDFEKSTSQQKYIPTKVYNDTMTLLRHYTIT